MKIVGHRGAKGLSPENTLASIKSAISAGADAVEFDVWVAKDNSVILSHNPYITGVNGQHLLISHHTHGEIKSVKPDVATLDEALNATRKQIPVLIELKSDSHLDPVIKAVKHRLDSGWPAESLVICSFNFNALKKFQEAIPEIRLMVIDRWSSIRAIRRAKRLSTRYLSINFVSLWPGIIASLSRRGFLLYTYTVNNPAKAKRWSKYGLAGVITDYPDRFKL